MVSTAALCSPAWDPCPPAWAGAGCWSLGFGGQTQGEDQDWLYRDSLKRVECGNWGCTRKKPGPTTEARYHCWGACKERGGTTIGDSFPVRTFSGNRTPPTWAPGAGASHHCHHGLQRQARAAATNKRTMIRHQVLSLLLQECAGHHRKYKTRKQPPSTVPAISGVCGPPPPLRDPRAGTNHSTQCPGSTHRPWASSSRCPCCPGSAWAITAAKRHRSRQRSLPLLAWGHTGHCHCWETRE